MFALWTQSKSSNLIWFHLCLTTKKTHGWCSTVNINEPTSRSHNFQRKMSHWTKWNRKQVKIPDETNDIATRSQWNWFNKYGMLGPTHWCRHNFVYAFNLWCSKMFAVCHQKESEIRSKLTSMQWFKECVILVAIIGYITLRLTIVMSMSGIPSESHTFWMIVWFVFCGSYSSMTREIDSLGANAQVGSRWSHFHFLYLM